MATSSLLFYLCLPGSPLRSSFRVSRCSYHVSKNATYLDCCLCWSWGLSVVVLLLSSSLDAGVESTTATLCIVIFFDPSCWGGAVLPWVRNVPIMLERLPAGSPGSDPGLDFTLRVPDFQTKAVQNHSGLARWVWSGWMMRRSVDCCDPAVLISQNFDLVSMWWPSMRWMTVSRSWGSSH